MTHVYRTTAASAALLVAVFGVTGCGADSPSSSPSTSAAAAFDDADATFASQMIPHHQQAVEMADLALRKATTAEVKNLATAIKAAQDPEIKQLSGWLTAWGRPVPTPGEHNGHGMAGMMGADELAELSRASGAMFDRMWTQMMIKHHQGAVAMAKTEQTTGKDPAAIALAKKIETTQTAEIATMQRLLGS
ncbi:DUF305 domain-containing protein [Kribbella sp. NBC_00662]|uniref:DUF305 domain-containing protein n=1 Tax=Kribbella sp. NBC_00662 TaxID=2975969 RepID=UPI0032524865